MLFHCKLIVLLESINLRSYTHCIWVLYYTYQLPLTALFGSNNLFSWNSKYQPNISLCWHSSYSSLLCFLLYQNIWCRPIYEISWCSTPSQLKSHWQTLISKMIHINSCTQTANTIKVQNYVYAWQYLPKK